MGRIRRWLRGTLRADRFEADAVDAGSVNTDAINTEQGFLSNLVLTRQSGTQITIQTGQAIADDGETVITVSSTLNADISTTGAGGRQSGLSVQSNSWYEVFVIADSDGSNPSAFLVEQGQSFDNPQSVSRRVGWIRTDSTAEIFKFHASGPYEIYWDDDTFHEALYTTSPATNHTTVDLSDYIPPSAENAILKLYSEGDGSSDYHHIRVKEPESITPQGHIRGWAANSGVDAVGVVNVPVDSQNVDYDTVRAASARIRVVGWVDHR